MTEQEQTTNQTQFFSEEILYEKPGEFLPDESSKKIVKKPFLKTLLGKIILGFGAFLVLILVFVLFTLNKPKEQEKEIEEKQTEQKGEETHLQIKLDNLQEQLEEADPTRKELPFPPVNLDIRLDK